MIEVSRTLSRRRNVKKIIGSRKSLDDVLLESYWVDSLGEEEIRELRRARASNSEILITDFLNSQNIRIPERVRQGEIPHSLIVACMDFDYQSGGSVNPATPVKMMAALAYSSLLKYAFAKRLSGEKRSKEDYKAIALLDYLYANLSAERRGKVEEELDLRKGIACAIRKSSLLNVIQSGIPIISQKNDRINNSFTRMSGKEIDVDDLEEFYNLGENDLPPNIDFSVDREAAELLIERKRLLDDLGYLVEAKVGEKRIKIEGEYQEIENGFLTLHQMDSLSDAESAELKRQRTRLHEMRRFYSAARIGDEPLLSKTASVISGIDETLRVYGEFKRCRGKIEEGFEHLKNSPKRFEEALRELKFDECKKVVDNARSAENFARENSENRYLRDLAKKNIEEGERFYSGISERLDLSKRDYRAQIEGLKEKRDGTKGVGGVFARVLINRKIKKYNGILEDLDRMSVY